MPRSVSIFSLLVQRESGQKEKARQGKGFRFPFPWTPSLKRQRRGLLPSFDPPCRCAGSIFFAAERHFRRGSRPAAAGGRRRQDAISAAAPLCAPEPFGRGPQTAFAARWIGSRSPCFPAGDGRAKTLSSVCEDGRITHSGAAVPVFRGGRDVEGAVPYIRTVLDHVIRGCVCSPCEK